MKFWVQSLEMRLRSCRLAEISRKKVKARIDKNQREYILREQLKLIRGNWVRIILRMTQRSLRRNSRNFRPAMR